MIYWPIEHPVIYRFVLRHRRLKLHYIIFAIFTKIKTVITTNGEIQTRLVVRKKHVSLSTPA